MVVSIISKTEKSAKVMLSGIGVSQRLLTEFVGKDIRACEERALHLYLIRPRRGHVRHFYGACQHLFKIATECDGTFSEKEACVFLNNDKIVFEFTFSEPTRCTRFVELVCEERNAGAF